MKFTPPTPEEAEVIARSKSAARRIQDDHLLKDYIREIFQGKANQLRREALVKLTGAKSAEEAFEAKTIAKTGEALDACYQVHLALSQEPKSTH